MEQEFYRDEFEQMLKDTTEDFRMYPSRKVWHSIYNDLHPDRKWPSFAVCLLLLTGILYLGVSNNNSINSKSRNNKINYSSFATENSEDKNKDQVVAGNGEKTIAEKNYSIASIAENKPIEKEIYIAGLSEFSNAKIIENNTVQDLNKNEQPVPQKQSLSFSENARTTVKITAPETEENNSTVETTEVKSINETSDVAISNSEEKENQTIPSLSNLQQTESKDSREWIDDFAFYNKKKEAGQFKGKWHTQFYVAPAIGYRVLFRNENYTANENALIATPAVSNGTGSEPNEQAALSIEAGAGVIKEISPKFRIKTGIQFNYSDFITNAQRLENPTTTTVAINSVYGVTMEDYNSSYANTPGKNNAQLHNRTLQLSIPLGFDYKLLGNKKVAWYAGASFQTTYIAGGYAWAQSADNNFYVEDPGLLRRWNFNAGVESFVSFRAPSGASINIGPQFRYQLMSTYTKRYTYTEKPYNIGFKIGLSKPL